MPTPTFTPGDEKQGEKLNPHAQDYNRRFNDIVSQSSEYPDVEKGLRDAEYYANNRGYSEQDTSLNELEQEPEDQSTYTNNYRGTPKKSKATLLMRLRKPGAIGGIAVLLLGGLGLLTTLFTPGLGIIHMKEVLTADLNDQLAAMDIRMDHVFKAKLKGMSKGVCTGVTIKCKFNTFSEKQVKRFEKAGFVIDNPEKSKIGINRYIITEIKFNDITIKDPAELTKLRYSNPEIRSALNRAFNPLYYSMSDKVANTFLLKNKTNKQKKITSSKKEDNQKALVTATAGERANGGVLRDGGGEYVYDEESKTKVYASETEKFNKIKAEIDAKAAKLNPGDGVKMTGKLLSGAVKGVGILGAVDSACTIYNIGRAVSAGAKTARQVQLIQFAMVINSEADAIMAGQGTVEGSQFVGEMLSRTDTRQTIVDETSGVDGTSKNPMYGKSAYDSPGFKTAAYNEAPVLTPQSQQYMVGGSMSGSLRETMSYVENIIGTAVGSNSAQSIRDGCGVVQSPWVRGVGLIAGIALAIGSFGISAAISMTASVALGFAQPFLEAMLTDIVAGTVIPGDIGGVEAGDAYFAGQAALLGGVAQGRGMKPLSKEGIQDYVAATSEAKDAIVAAEKYEASKTPFDVNSQYSFIGSLTRNLYPTALSAQANGTATLLSFGKLLGVATNSLTKNTSAAQEFNEARFSQCTDPGYEELGIDADIFCNVRYGLSASELAMDTDEVVDYMLSKGYIDEEGVAKDGPYKDFLRECVDRTEGWGESNGEGGVGIGLECIEDADGSRASPDISYFRVYTFDSGMSDAIDGDVDPKVEGSSIPSSELIGQYVLPVKPGYPTQNDSQDWGPRNICASADPNSYCKVHRGVDFSGGSAAAGKPVYAVTAGEVVSPGGDSIYQSNNPVHIKHADGTIATYLHMQNIQVRVGDTVETGQQIGSVGDAGQSDGAHLHLSILLGSATNEKITSLDRLINGSWTYINPTAYMRLYGVDVVNGRYIDGR